MRRAIERLGGSITAESQPRTGTTFHINLPRQRVSAPDTASAATALL